MAPIMKKRSAIPGNSESAEMFSSDSNAGSSVETDASEHGAKYAKVNRIVLEKNSDEYKKRRERNNMAVKKSRNKSKVKTIQTLERVNQLKAENDELQTKIDILSKELRLLKDLFMAHASTAHGSEVADVDLAIFGNSRTEQNGQGSQQGSTNAVKVETSERIISMYP